MLARGETVSQQLTQSNAQLADAQQQLAAMKQQMAELDKTVTADKATIQACRPLSKTKAFKVIA